MLCLHRKKGEKVIIDLRPLGVNKLIAVVALTDARLGFEGAANIPIHRSEIFAAIERQKAGGA